MAVPLGYDFWCSIFYFPRHSAASFSTNCLTCDMCLRFRGCPVAELSITARHQKTRVVLCARRLVLLLVAAAASGGVWLKFQITCNKSEAK